MNVAAHQPEDTCYVAAKPFLKWAGGKTQLLSEIHQCVPKKYNRYIEPFVGGGAVFFSLRPVNAIICDSNPELANVYRCVRDNVDEVIGHLKVFRNTEAEFYKVRQKAFADLDIFYAAARTIFLNRTCYNGLYRVNQRGRFNVPFGYYKNPVLCNDEALLAASLALKGVEIICGDYKDVLNNIARAGDFIYLDPPYIPVSKFSDFKRYTKEQFHESHHRELAEEVKRLQRLGCHVVLTNSNHAIVHELYHAYGLKIVNTRRNISSRAGTRTSEDVIVKVLAHPRSELRLVPEPIDTMAASYPPTRFMGSKEKLLPYIRDIAQNFQFDSVLDLFSGSGVVSHLFKTMNKLVYSNDYMAMSATFARAMIENSDTKLSERDVDGLFLANPKADTFVQNTFRGLYFEDHENAVIDLVRANIKEISNTHKQAIAMSALVRACLKKRARGIFTYTGLRYNDGRADLKMSMEAQVRNAVALINGAVFDNGLRHLASCENAMNVEVKADLVYIDPPYFSPLSDNEYVRRYHFVEGLARDWQGVDLQWHTKTRKFRSYPTPFSSRNGASIALERLFKRLKDSIIMVSYSSNSLPSREEITSLMAKYKNHVEVIDIDHRYSFANQGSKISENRNQVKEYIFVGY